MILFRNTGGSLDSTAQTVRILRVLLSTPIGHCGIPTLLFPVLLKYIDHPSRDISLLSLLVLEKFLPFVDPSLLDRDFAEQVLAVSLLYNDPCLQLAVSRVIPYIPISYLTLVAFVAPFY